MSSKVLVIVEGEGREDLFFRQIQKAFAFKMEIVPFCGNVSMLYDEMEKTGFMSDITTLLRQKTTDPEKLAVLNDTYSDIVLIFDLDPQHSVRQLAGESPEDALKRNSARIMDKALKMARQMKDSTDPTLGKLYINYPSIESYRDADDFFDACYAEKKVPIKNLCKTLGGRGYKAIAADARLSNQKRLTAYTSSDFSLLTAMNAFKLRKMHDGEWTYFPYEDFRQWSEQDCILGMQGKLIEEVLSLWVLNTSLFFLIDYKGKRFYEELCLAVSHPVA